MDVVTVRAPIFVPSDQLERTLGYYEAMLGHAATRRFTAPGGIEVAFVDPVCVIAAPPQTLASLPPVTASIEVRDPLEDCTSQLIDQGAEVLQPPGDSPIGRNAYVRNPDGSVFELLAITQD